ncbi:MAG: glycosyltransferase [Candidatus Cloacimonetes bacterium]|nr:glycosyltransferase [Candidatus Cloacimonadota bacterium]
MDIITRLNVGGASIHVINLSSCLKKHYDTILVSGTIEPHESDMSYYAEEKNVSIHYLKKMSREIKFYNDLLALWEIYLLIKKEKPDIVHTHTTKAGTLGRIAAFLAGVPTIIHTFHGNIFKGYFSKRKTIFFIYIEKFLSKITTVIIALSEKQKNELIDLNITKHEKIKVIKLGLDFTHILATQNDFGKFREKYNIPIDSLCVAIIGRITAIKNHKLFIDIAERLKNKNIYFAIVGDGELRKDIQSEINKRKIDNKVFITGFIKDLKPIYADVDIVLITSFNEGTPVALIEAMINGKIAVSTNVGGISDIVENGINGFYFDDFHVNQFVDTILLFLENKINKASISEKAKKTAKSVFHIDRLINDLISLYENVCSDAKSTISS